MIKINSPLVNEYRMNPSLARLLRKIWSKVLMVKARLQQPSNIKWLINNLYQQEKLPLPYEIEIESHNKCNGSCSFCIINKNLDKRLLVKMSEEDFKKIIDDLAAISYKGQINYHSNNEPLLDSRIYDFIKYGVSKLPNAYHQMLSNGTLLTEDVMERLINSGLDLLEIDNYNDELKLNPNIQEIYDKYKDKSFKMDCIIHIRLQNEVLNNRAGTAPNKPKLKKPPTKQCVLPFLQIIIRADCGVSLCCNDALGKVTIGNTKEQSIEEIWYGKKHFEYMTLMKEGKREAIQMCKECDCIGIHKRFIEAYINQVRKT